MVKSGGEGKIPKQGLDSSFLLFFFLLTNKICRGKWRG